MFAIYNSGSVGFRSTADNLYELKNTDAPAEARLKPDDDTLFQEYMDSKNKKQGSNSHAINSYKKMANIDTNEPIYHVGDIMTENCVFVKSTATLKEAYEILKKNRVSQIPVVHENKKIYGLINKKIILNEIMDDIDNSRLVIQKYVKDIQASELITTDPISDIRRVAKVMIDFRLDAIPVVNEEDVLVGIVSKTDIIKAVSNIPSLQLWG
ncbi:HPP family protein [Arcobacter sp. YIC-464]|uniref:CBS domain-containing protein n=1 Tax=Arcobacter sp. YIC-464 TaxID=3376631 RepID=UPI003C1D10C0